MAAVLDHAGCLLLLLPVRRSLLRRRRHHLASFGPPPCAHRRLTSASATTSVYSSLAADEIGKEEVCTSLSGLACPICYYPLSSKGHPTLSGKFSTLSSLECNTCKKSYKGNEAYIDMTIATGSEEYTETLPTSTELFRSPLVSFLYERGWRQNFVVGGFPGPEKEFELAKDYLKPSFGGTIIDASCGSGLFSRMFSRSGLYKLVIALDFSENMLRQCDDYIKEEGISKENLVLVRADISRLPFVSSSVDAVHAGAALHCWPSPSTAVAEISRVLRPGGAIVATTFIADGIFASLPFLSLARQVFNSVTGQRVYISQGELEDLCRACGLENVTCVRNGPFVMIAATKPS